MKRIGLIDVDGHNFPNLALMRISSYHKTQGDTVEWWWTDMLHYDIVYMSKIFSSAYSTDVPEPVNADQIIKGGTGYCQRLSARVLVLPRCREGGALRRQGCGRVRFLEWPEGNTNP